MGALRKNLGRRWIVLFYILTGVAMTAVMLGLVITDAAPLRSANYTTLDDLFGFRQTHGFPVKKSRIVLVTFNEGWGNNLGVSDSVPPRDYQARLTSMLVADGAKVIGFDTFFRGPKPEDAVFSKALRDSRRTVLQIQWDSGSNQSDTDTLSLAEPPPALLAAAAAVGYDNIPNPDAGDASYRRETMTTQDLHGTVYLSWPAALAQAYLGGLPQNLLAANEFMINYVDAGRSVDFPDVPYEQFFLQGSGQPPPDPALFKDSIVLVGSESALLKDTFNTPLDPNRPGVDIMANALNTILNNNPITPVDPSIQDVLLIVLGLLTTALATRLSLRAGALLAVALMLGWIVFVLYMFAAHGVWLNVTAPALTIPLVYLSILAIRYFTEEREKRRIRDIFSHYVSPQVVNKLVEQGLTLEGQRKEITVLFSDIRGFTTLSESLNPAQVVWFLNQYFERMADIVFRYGGTLDKYVGDAVMALWNAPDDVADPALKAAQAALEMRQTVEDLRPIFQTISEHHLAIGIGINTGFAVVGTLGSGRKREYTAIGDTVNVASRLEGLNKQFGTDICVSGEVVPYLPADADLREQGEVQVKGRSEPIKVYSLHALHGAARHSLPRGVPSGDPALRTEGGESIRDQPPDAASRTPSGDPSQAAPVITL